MNRDKQIMKDIANKQAQAREMYAKNKPLLAGSKLQEKTDGHIIPQGEPECEEDRLKKNVADDRD